MIFHENHLPADDSHEISWLFCYFRKAAKFELTAAANYRWWFMGKYPANIFVSKIGMCFMSTVYI